MIVLRPRQEQAIADLRTSDMTPGLVINENTVLRCEERRVYFICRHGVEFSRWFSPNRIASTRCPCDHSRISNNRTHGETRNSEGKRTPEYTAWKNMHTRCRNKNFVDFDIYGGRGIKVCYRWNMFENFLSDMGRRPSAEHSLDRIESDRDYEPGNCRWATRTEQARNRRYCIRVSYKGETRLLTEWCDMLGINRKLTYGRLRNGWSVERAFQK